ncbi:MAG: hypothetical protein DCC68_25850 [Planctomycetota bacterium]|nr:MAG: hypothetical protein DCC68_25850 [Planctomycetota bacterium]
MSIEHFDSTHRVATAVSRLPAASEHAPIVHRYKTLRAATARLAEKLIKTLPRGAFNEAGKRLGIVHGGTLIFDSESDMAVLADYCIYELRNKGRNAVDLYAMRSPPAADTDESRCLRAMQAAVYSVFIIENVVHGVGLYVRDLVSDTMYFVVDVSLSTCARVAEVFASRLLLFEDFAMTSGAALPIGQLDGDLLSKFETALAHDFPADARGYRDPAALIQTLLQAHRAAYVRFADPTGEVPAQRGALADASAFQRGGRVGRNDPCPCGSGRKFKHCCWRKG